MKDERPQASIIIGFGACIVIIIDLVTSIALCIETRGYSDSWKWCKFSGNIVGLQIHSFVPFHKNTYHAMHANMVGRQAFISHYLCLLKVYLIWSWICLWSWLLELDDFWNLLNQSQCLDQILWNLNHSLLNLRFNCLNSVQIALNFNKRYDPFRM